MDLWVEASRDIETEQAALRMASAKVSVAGLWPFLSLAQSAEEFEHRLALTHEHIAGMVPAELLHDVQESLRSDFSSVTAAKDAEGKEDASEDDDDKPDWLKEKIDKSSSRTVTAYWHVGRKEWVTASADDTPGGGNPAYFVGGPEAGPATGMTNQYAPHPLGADPVDPINGEFPMEPTPWTVTPGTEWKENPMNFSPPLHRSTSAWQHGDTATCTNCISPIKRVPVSWGSGGAWTHTGPDGAYGDDDHEPVPQEGMRATQNWPRSDAQSHRYMSGLVMAQEGVEGRPGPNQYYFSGGTEGAGGDPQQGFPQDMASLDPQDRVNELYGPSPMAGGMIDSGNHVAQRRQAEIDPGHPMRYNPENPAPNSNLLQGTEFDSPQERERWQIAQAPERQQDSRASFTGSRQFFDPHDTSVRVVAENTNPFSGDNNPFSAAPDSGMGADPMSDMAMGGGVPQTTHPRQMPGSANPMGDTSQSPSDRAAKENSSGQAMARRRVADVQSYERPNDSDPTGAGDEYRHNTWEGPIQTRPRQSPEHRNINTPQQPDSPISMSSSPGPGQEDDEARRFASHVVRELVNAS